METLTINIPDKKSTLVKQILKKLGVAISVESNNKLKPADYVKIINLSKADAEKMSNDIAQSRNEWERDI